MKRFAKVTANLNDADADDLLAEALARTYIAHTAGRVRQLDSYLYRVIRNQGRSLGRRAQVAFKHLPIIEARERSRFVDSVDSLVAVREPVRDLLKRLPTRQRQALYLDAYEDMSDEQIAKVMGVAIGTVARTLERARFNLAENARRQGFHRDS